MLLEKKKQKCWLVHSLGYTDKNRTEQKSAHAINPVPECPSWSDVGVPMGAHATGCSRWICVGRRAVGVNQHLLFVRCAEVRPHVDNDPDGMQSWHAPIARVRRIDPLVMIIVRFDWKCVLASLHCLFGLCSSGVHGRFVTKMQSARNEPTWYRNHFIIRIELMCSFVLVVEVCQALFTDLSIRKRAKHTHAPTLDGVRHIKYAALLAVPRLCVLNTNTFHRLVQFTPTSSQPQLENRWVHMLHFCSTTGCLHFGWLVGCCRDVVDIANINTYVWLWARCVNWRNEVDKSG